MEPWWRGAILYHIYPRSFLDTNNDGVGDLPGITAKLDYVADLGVDGIWLSPFFTSPMQDFGYDIADFCDVDPLFGTIADFDALSAKAHSLGLKVIIDQVYSHSSHIHPWFQTSRQDRHNDKADWYVWADAKADGTAPNNWMSVFAGPAWTWDARRNQYYLHNFLPGQPDLNLHNLAVQDALLDVARFWLDRGVDGFRLDATNFYMHDPKLRNNPPSDAAPDSPLFSRQWHWHNQSHPDILKFLKRLRTVMDSYGARYTVAEIGGENAQAEMLDYTAGSDLLSSAYSFAFLEAPKLTPRFVRDQVEVWQGRDAASGWPAWAFSNHDRPRALSRWGEPEGDARLAKLCNGLLGCLRGTSFLYQGEELGLPQGHVPYDQLQDPEAIANWPRGLGRDGTRTPMPWTDQAPHGGFTTAAEPWLPMDVRHLARAAACQSESAKSVLHFTRSFLHLRKDYPALREGDLVFHHVGEAILSFDRVLDGNRIRCVFNLGDTPRPAPDEKGFVLLSINEGAPGIELPAYGGYLAQPVS